MLQECQKMTDNVAEKFVWDSSLDNARLISYLKLSGNLFLAWYEEETHW